MASASADSIAVVDSDPLQHSPTDSCTDISSSTCVVCNEEFQLTELYRCLSCLAVDKGDGNEIGTTCEDKSSIPFHCEFCIMGLHLRKNHKIIDHKGYKPAVCQRHKIIPRAFCEDCQLVICSSCIISHSNHKFISVSEKCVETRKEIFEHLNTLENLFKPIKHQEDVAKSSMEELTKFRDTFGPPTFVNSLCKFFEHVIRSNDSEWRNLLGGTDFSSKLEVPLASEKILGSSVELRQKNDSDTNSLRNLLQMSDGESVQNFLELKKTILNSIDVQSEGIKKHLYLAWNVDLEQVVQSVVKKVAELVTNGKIMTTDYRIVTLGCEKEVKRYHYKIDWHEISLKMSEDISIIDLALENSEMYNVTYEEDSVAFCLFGKQQNEIFYRNETYSFSNCVIKKILKHKFFIAFLTAEQRIRIYCLRAKSFIDYFNFREELEPLEFGYGADGCFMYTVWNYEQNRIEVLNTSQIDHTVNLVMKPKLFLNLLTNWVIIEPNNDLIVYSLPTKIKVTISKLRHGLSQVDNVCGDRKSFYLFDYRMGLSLKAKVKISSSNAASCSIIEVVKFEPQITPYDCMFVNEGKYHTLASNDLYVENSITKSEDINISGPCAEPSSQNLSNNSTSSRHETNSEGAFRSCGVKRQHIPSVDRKASSSDSVKKKRTERPKTHSNGWRCRFCQHKNPQPAIVCQSCHKVISD